MSFLSGKIKLSLMHRCTRVCRKRVTIEQVSTLLGKITKYLSTYIYFNLKKLLPQSCSSLNLHILINIQLCSLSNEAKQADYTHVYLAL